MTIAANRYALGAEVKEDGTWYAVLLADGEPFLRTDRATYDWRHWLAPLHSEAEALEQGYSQWGFLCGLITHTTVIRVDGELGGIDEYPPSYTGWDEEVENRALQERGS